MNVPTILSDGRVQTGSTGPTADPSDFGAGPGYARLSQGIEDIAQSTTAVSSALRAKKDQDNVLWASQSLEQEKNYLNKWMSNPDNNTKSTFADDLQDLSKQRIQEYARSAPSKQAAELFQTHYNSFTSERYESALQQSAKNKVQGLLNSVDTQSADVMAAYRNALVTPGIDAAAELRTSVDSVSGAIDQAFGKTSPALATKLKEKLLTDASYATMRDDPNLARQLLDQNKTLDEHMRFEINDRIDQAQRSKYATEIVAFDSKRADFAAAAEMGKSRGKIGLSEYQSYYPRDHALTLKAKDDALIDTYDHVNSRLDSIKSLNAPAQLRALQDLKDTGNTAEDQITLQLMAHHVQQAVELQQKDPTQFLQTNNPEVRGIWEQQHQVSQDLQNDPNNTAMQHRATQLRSEMYDALLKYQGSPGRDQAFEIVNDPKGGYNVTYRPKQVATEQYLNLPTNGRHLMTASEAEQNADYINRGTPKQKLQLIQQVLAQYPDERHQNIAFNDMVTLPRASRGIKQEFQLAFLNRNAPWVDNYLGAVSTTESIKDVQPDKRQDYEKALTANPQWTAFAHSMMGDNFQRGDQVDGFKNGIMTYAYALATRDGMSAERAIKQAAGELIGTELGFISVNGRSLTIAKDQGVGKPYMVDGEMRNIGKNLEMSLSHIDPREIKTTDQYGRNIFPILAAAGTDQVRMQGLRNALLKNGVFETSADGRSATLYYHDAENHFELRDKNDNAFRIRFEDAKDPYIWWGKMDPNKPGSNDLLLRSPLVSTGTNTLYPVPYTSVPSMDRTNWPSVPFIRREKR